MLLGVVRDELHFAHVAFDDDPIQSFRSVADESQIQIAKETWKRNVLRVLRKT